MTADPSPAGRFAPGQVWRYTTRKGESRSRVIVCAVETFGEDVVVHAFIEKVKVKNEQAPGGVSRSIAHMPFALEAFESSVTELDEIRDVLPKYREGYETWREAEGGCFTVSIAEAVELMEQTLNG